MQILDSIVGLPTPKLAVPNWFKVRFESPSKSRIPFQSDFQTVDDLTNYLYTFIIFITNMHADIKKNKTSLVKNWHGQVRQ